jgi:GT2 family glycosyltransferase
MVFGPEYCPNNKEDAKISNNTLFITITVYVTTAVIPVHNRAELLSRLLDTIGHQTIPFAEIVVVDNLSTDGAAELARSRGCRVIAMGENAGFARAVNAGCKAAASELVAVLNSDVELDSHWVEELQNAIGNNAFATGLILDAASRSAIDGTYDLVGQSACAWRAGSGDPAPARTPSAIEEPRAIAIAIAPATACIFRRDVLASLGGFDERYGSYLEDVDLGLRCVRHGYSGVYVPRALASHHGSATLGRWNPRVVRLISRNQLLLVRRHYDNELFRSCFWKIVAGQALWGLVALRHGAALSWIAGKWEALQSFHLEGTPSLALRNFLSASEREIESRARDSYWRWYFRLTGHAAH